MLRLLSPEHRRPAAFPPLAARLTMVGAGLAALSLVAVLSAVLWQRPAPPDLPRPEIWLGSLAVPPQGGFAAPDYRAEAQLPRERPALPPLPDRAAAVPQASEPAAVAVARRSEAPGADRQRADGPRAEPPLATPSPPEAPRLQTPAPDTVDLAIAQTRAPARSPLPRARPIPEGLADAAPEPALAALGPEGGLLRSRIPSRRPETVARLASLSLDVPAPSPERAEPGVTLSVPGIDQAVADVCAPTLARAIPRRSGGMAGGNAVVSGLMGSGGRSRDDALADQIAAGNLPDFLRDLVPVTFTSGEGRQRTRITLCVMPDYLAVGSDRDFVRVPLGLPAAMRLAERFDMVLPTTRMVDAIHAQASLRLSPAPMEPGAQMASTQYFLRHNATVEAQRQRSGGRLGQLVAGHKKDLVLTNRLNANPGRVAIYGWHRGNGAPIQPLSTVHGAEYADYSHGIRLVSRTAYVNGRAVDLRDLLGDSRLAGIVSSEGTITHRTLLAALR